MLGFVCSKNFVLFLRKKMQSFLSSQLHFDVNETNFFESKDKNIIFIGFNIKFFNNRRYSYKNIISPNKNLSKLLARLTLEQKRIRKISLERFKSEFFINVNNMLDLSTKEISSFFSNKKIFSYIFQLEAVRSIRINKLILTDDKQFIASNEISCKIKNFNVNDYHKYNFDLYNLRMQILLRDILKSFPDVRLNSTLTIDLKLNQYLSEFKKKIVFVYNDYNFRGFSSNSKLMKKDFNKLSPILYQNDFYKDNVLDIRNKLLVNNNYYNSNEFIDLFIPFNLLILKLRSLGFVHPHKSRPIGNAKFLFFEDSLIIKSFGYIAYSMLHWYGSCNNLYAIKFIIELLRESCFLTLCRKHNKSKNWAYCVYTSDLIVFQGLFDTKSFFPTRKFILNLKKL